MERDTTSLYTTLELTKSATPEEIKKVDMSSLSWIRDMKRSSLFLGL